MPVSMLLWMACAVVPVEPGSLLVSVHRPPPSPLWGASMAAVSPKVMLWHFDQAAHTQAEMQRLLEAEPWVEHVEPNIPLQLLTSDEAAVWAQRDLRGTQGYLHALAGLLRFPGGHAAPRLPRVGILDTGIDVAHPDLQGNIADGINLLYDPDCTVGCSADATDAQPMDFNGHGTAIAGLIGARHNSFGVDGLNDTVALLPIKAFDREGRGNLAQVLAGLTWARAHRVHVLNMSFGTPVWSRLLAEAVAETQKAGVLVVAAVGNQGAGDVLYPARLPNVIAVGSRNAAGISPFSNTGAGVSIYAPGEGLMSTQSSARGPNIYAPISGTSAAAAYVTGLLSQVVASGRSGGAARAYLKQHTLPLQRREQLAPTVNAQLLLANLQSAPVTSLTALVWSAPSHALPNMPIKTKLTLTNSGNVALPRLPLRLMVQRGGVIERIDAGELPTLQPGKTIHRHLVVTLPTVDAVAVAGEEVVMRLAVDAADVSFDAPSTVTRITSAQVPSVHVDRIWLSTADTDKTPVAVQIRNDGNVALPAQSVQVFSRAATHEGLFLVQPEELTHVAEVPKLAPGAAVTLRLPATAPLPSGDPFTLQATLSYGKNGEGHDAFQSFELSNIGELMPQYSGDAHVGSVATAVELLRMAGVFVADVHAEDVPFRGTPETTYDFGTATQLGRVRRGWSWQTDWPPYPSQSKTLLDGARACDAVDVAYGEHGTSVYNTHFWVVDENDHASLGEHSALDKIMALMLGGHGSQIDDGAIAAYNNGDKARAWWLVGHAAHLIGDLSTGSHTINRNWHGLLGDPFHDWLSHGEHYQGWTADQALAEGGMIDPYLPGLTNTAERLRYLAYTTAQIGSAFPWRRTRGYVPAKGPREGIGNRVLAGDLPHYESIMEPLLAKLPTHPMVVRDLDNDEVKDSTGACIVASGVGKNEQRADCWDGADEHVCMANTASGGNDADGDLSRIADATYVYALRSIAGLVYLFAQETGQL